ncbi:MAG: hypothetical protein JWO48_314 [Bryobacterales bacterium]|nr:hypothetical protein [Bryobacterales bacterium]
MASVTYREVDAVKTNLSSERRRLFPTRPLEMFGKYAYFEPR